MRAILATTIVLLVARPVAGQPPRVSVKVVADEAETVLAILTTLRRGRPVASSDWQHLLATAGYRRLQRREAAMGRPLLDADFKAFVMSKDLAEKAPDLAATLAKWRAADLGEAASRALAYLPPTARVVARVYPVIKPASNSFVFETGTDSAAIFLYLDPAVSPERFANTVAHEFHHIGFARACQASRPQLTGPLEVAVDWMSAFGEGVAILAAAGGTAVHPHQHSDSADRHRWDRDVARAPEDLAAVERFFTGILDRTVVDQDSITAAGMTFFGVQGPWYTIGYLMALEVERADGRQALIDALCDPRRLIARYQAVAAASGGRLPQWSRAFVERLDP